MVSLFELLSFKSQVEIEIKKLKSGVAPIIIYGAGLYSKWMFMFLKWFCVLEWFVNPFSSRCLEKKVNAGASFSLKRLSLSRAVFNFPRHCLH